LNKEDAQLDEILAKGSLGGPEYDRILQRVLDRTAPSPRQRSFRLLGWLAVPAVAAAAGWLMFAGTSHPPEFTVKSGAGTAAGAIDAACSPSGPRVCRYGEALVFTVNAAIASGYLGAYAERVGDPAAARIWYFPAGGRSAPAVEAGTGTVAVPDAIQIGSEHEAGLYRVTAWISAQPIDQSQIGPAGPKVFVSRSDLELKIAP